MTREVTSFVKNGVV